MSSRRTFTWRFEILSNRQSITSDRSDFWTEIGVVVRTLLSTLGKHYVILVACSLWVICLNANIADRTCRPTVSLSSPKAAKQIIAKLGRCDVQDWCKTFDRLLFTSLNWPCSSLHGQAENNLVDRFWHDLLVREISQVFACVRSTGNTANRSAAVAVLSLANPIDGRSVLSERRLCCRSSCDNWRRLYHGSSMFWGLVSL